GQRKPPGAGLHTARVAPSRAGRAARSGAGRARIRPGSVPGAPDPAVRALDRGLLLLRADALAGRAGAAIPGPAGGHREPPRRQRHAARPSPGRRSAGRLHAGADAPVGGAASVPRAPAAVGHRGRLHPHPPPVRLDVRRGREGRQPPPQLGRPRRLRPHQPRAADLRHQRHRHHQPLGHGGPRGARGRAVHARALPR
ncbi:MAG: Tricarboxylate transport protein TctC, partial [uncultured Craurococcus sp.]